MLGTVAAEGIPRAGWQDLPKVMRDKIEEITGPFIGERQLTMSRECRLATVMTARSGTYLLKGVLTTEFRAVAGQHRQWIASGYTGRLAPVLVFHIKTVGWDVLGFEYLSGYRHANMTPDSRDLHIIRQTLGKLSQVTVPTDTQDIQPAQQRWLVHLGKERANLLAGNTLCQNDLSPANVLIGDASAKLVNWSRPTAGAAWLDTANAGLHLIEAGHDPKEAAAWCQEAPAFAAASADAVTAYVTALAAMWRARAERDPVRWKLSRASHARTWAVHRAPV